MIKHYITDFGTCFSPIYRSVDALYEHIGCGDVEFVNSLNGSASISHMLMTITQYDVLNVWNELQ